MIKGSSIPAVSITNKCIVLDLDSTLLHTQGGVDSLEQLKILSDPELLELRQRIYYFTLEELEGPGTGTSYKYWGVSRPHVHEFLLFCFSYFKIVAVWSAGQPKYVEAAVDHLFRDLPRPHVVFTSEDMESVNVDDPLKPLQKMIDSDPVLAKYMRISNTFAVDDIDTNFTSNPGSGILVPPYRPAKKINAMKRDDPTLLQLKAWLLRPEVVAAEDVALLNKDTIFTTGINTPTTGYHLH